MIKAHADDLASDHGVPTCSGCPDLGDPYTGVVDGIDVLTRLCLRKHMPLPEGGAGCRPGWCPLVNPKAGHDVP